VELRPSVVIDRELTNRLMLRARDAMDRDYRSELDVPALARIACVSQAHFIRTFKATFGETPTRYRTRGRLDDVPSCFVKAWIRPSSFGEAP
jgi:transcriptional regulator GlxA family with amidase domain